MNFLKMDPIRICSFHSRLTLFPISLFLFGINIYNCFWIMDLDSVFFFLSKIRFDIQISSVEMGILRNHSRNDMVGMHGMISALKATIYQIKEEKNVYFKYLLALLNFQVVCKYNLIEKSARSFFTQGVRMF